MKKLSELNDDVEVAYEEGDVYTVAELKAELLDPICDDEFFYKQWFLIERKRWKPDAQSMVESFIDNEYQDMYEDWDERAMDCFNKNIITELQDILDKAFKSDYATVYWNHAEAIEIDIAKPSEG